MLEAAMLGIPYTGRMPDFSAGSRQSSAPADPEVVEARLLRDDQDAAYHASLEVSISLLSNALHVCFVHDQGAVQDEAGACLRLCRGLTRVLSCAGG